MIREEDGHRHLVVMGHSTGGLLAITRPWPSQLRTIWGDDERYVQTYFSKWPGRPDLYFPGDGAKRDDDGYYWLLGRVDDVLNVAGHRIGTDLRWRDLADADLRQGIFYCAIGIALMVILGMEVLGNPPKVALLGILPLSIGIGYFILMFLSRDKKSSSDFKRDSQT